MYELCTAHAKTARIFALRSRLSEDALDLPALAAEIVEDLAESRHVRLDLAGFIAALGELRQERVELLQIAFGLRDAAIGMGQANSGFRVHDVPSCTLSPRRPGSSPRGPTVTRFQRNKGKTTAASSHRAI